MRSQTTIDEPSLAEVHPPAPRAEDRRDQLAVLQALVEAPEPVLEPALDPGVPRGHSFGTIEERLSIPPGRGLELLEELEELGLARRELFNTIHLCPRCERGQINFRKTCPACGSIDLDLEGRIRHLPCGHVGLESELTRGLELVCPKCRRDSSRQDEDFERLRDTWVCRDSGHRFDEPAVEGECLCCGHLFDGAKVEPTRVHRFRPTPLSTHAVEVRRLTGLGVHDVLCDPDCGLATRDLLTLAIRHEIRRRRRSGGSFSTATLTFRLGGRGYRIFREWPSYSTRELGKLLVASVRSRDLVARLDRSRVGFLLLDATETESRAVGERILAELDRHPPSTPAGQPLVPEWRVTSWAESAEPERIMAWLGSGFADG